MSPGTEGRLEREIRYELKRKERKRACLCVVVGVYSVVPRPPPLPLLLPLLRKENSERMPGTDASHWSVRGQLVSALQPPTRYPFSPRPVFSDRIHTRRGSLCCPPPSTRPSVPHWHSAHLIQPPPLLPICDTLSDSGSPSDCRL